MKQSDYGSQSIDALNTELAALDAKLEELYTQQATSEVKQVHEFGQLKKNRARIKTFLRQKALATEASDG